MLNQLIIPSLVGIIFGFVCSNKAKKKNKSPLLWFQLGFFFGVLALLGLFLILFKERSNAQKLATEEASVAAAAPSTETPPPLEDKSHTTLNTRDWYYLDSENKQVGPVSFDLLKKEHLANKILDKTLLWSIGMEDWKSFDQLSYLQMVMKNEATSSL